MNRHQGSIRRRLLPLLLGVALLLPATTGRAVGAGVRTWTETPTRLSRGEADGVAIGADGTLFAAPQVGRLGEDLSPGEAQQVWSLVVDDGGNVYLGTGPDGRILKIAPSGARSRLARLEEPLVTALAIAADGTLLAGASPGGRIYRVSMNGAVELFAETDEQYVWSLVVAADGTIHAGTGERGRVLRISASGRSEPFFDSGESHIMALVPIDDGAFLAGGAGRGLLFEIDAEGNAVVHHDGELPQVASMALEPDGAIIAAWIAAPDREERRPALKLTLPDGTQVGSTDETVGSLEQPRGPVLRGTIEGLPPGARPEAARKRGVVMRIEPDGQAIELWSSSDEAPFCLVRDSRNRLVFGAGEPARLYGLETDGHVALLETLDESQVTALARNGRALVAATSNPAATYRVGRDAAESGVFTSLPADAGAVARWGAISWNTTGDEGRVELFTRTGNSPAPDRTWSAWSPALFEPAGSGIVNPDGRYLQWRARFVGTGMPETGMRLTSISISYEPYNRAPQARGFEIEGGVRAVADEAVFTWSAADPDGDPVELELSYRRAGSSAWAGAARVLTGEAGPGKIDDGGKWHEGRMAWETRALDEGPYEIRARINDRAANDPADGREVDLGVPRRLVVDRTPPSLGIRPVDGGGYQIVVTEAHSTIHRLELLLDDRVLYSIRPTDGLCDSGEETFRVVPPPVPGSFAVRGVDAAGNRAEEPLPPPE